MVYNFNNQTVSIIIPCYNGERFIERAFDSIINQTYKNLEIIFVNDGSKDQSENIVKKYFPIFQKENMKIIYIYQENKGLGGAINTGLKHFSGQFLCWIDIDDYLECTSIEERVNFLENNQEYGVVTSDAYIRKSDCLENVIGLCSDGIQHNDDVFQFEKLLKSDSIFCSGCHMIRAKHFLEVNSNREIYEYKKGQNWQMLLPVYYKYKRFFLNKPLYNYIIYSDSMSHKKLGINDEFSKIDEHANVIYRTLEAMNLNQDEIDKYMKIANSSFLAKKYIISLKYKNRDKAKSLLLKILKSKCYSGKQKIKYIYYLFKELIA